MHLKNNHLSVSEQPGNFPVDIYVYLFPCPAGSWCTETTCCRPSCQTLQNLSTSRRLTNSPWSRSEFIFIITSSYITYCAVFNYFPLFGIREQARNWLLNSEIFKKTCWKVVNKRYSEMLIHLTINATYWQVNPNPAASYCQLWNLCFLFSRLWRWATITQWRWDWSPSTTLQRKRRMKRMVTHTIILIIMYLWYYYW